MMGEIVLIRHGQANTGAKDEASYDRLSPLGHQQSAWLGDYFKTHGFTFDHVISGTLRRHQETAAGLALDGKVALDDRLNEMRYFDMAHAYQDLTGTPLPDGADEFVAHAPLVFQAWRAGDLDHAHMPFAEFAARGQAVLDEAAARPGRTLLATSGGVIAVLMAGHLNLGTTALVKVLLPILNSSVHRYHENNGAVYLSGYNATPHLDAADRIAARTYL